MASWVVDSYAGQPLLRLLVVDTVGGLLGLVPAHGAWTRGMGSVCWRGRYVAPYWYLLREADAAALLQQVQMPLHDGPVWWLVTLHGDVYPDELAVNVDVWEIRMAGDEEESVPALGGPIHNFDEGGLSVVDFLRSLEVADAASLAAGLPVVARGGPAVGPSPGSMSVGLAVDPAGGALPGTGADVLAVT